MKTKSGSFQASLRRSGGKFYAFIWDSGSLLFAVRKSWHLELVNPKYNPSVWRLYIGPYEIQYTRYQALKK